MRNKLFTILILLALALVIAVPAPVVAMGATHTHFTATAESLCFTMQPPPEQCSWGEPKLLPNGKVMLTFVNVVRITAQDDRYTGIGIVTISIAPGGPQGFPFHGTWILHPDNYDGYWEGVVAERVTPEGEYTEISGKGYGDLAGLLLIDQGRGGFHEVTIIELPEYKR